MHPLRFIGCFLLVAGLARGQSPAGTVVLNELLRAELVAMSAEDQRVRKNRPSTPSDAQRSEMREIDARNARRIEEIVSQHGWPGKSLVGVEGAHQAWLLVQHCDLEFQEICLPMLEKAVVQGEAASKDYAYLLDRVLMRRGKPQIYGTQYKTIAGKNLVHPIWEPEKIDERRRSVGLGAWAEYDQRMRKSDEPTLAPVKDVALREEISRMAAENIRVRRTRRADMSTVELQELAAQDAAHLKRLKEILAEHGWPGTSLVGADVGHEFFRLVALQGNPSFLSECVSLLEKAWRSGQAAAVDFATLTDALRLAEGKLQIYGTLSVRKDGTLERSPIEDPERVNERRAAIGLEPLR